MAPWPGVTLAIALALQTAIPLEALASPEDAASWIDRLHSKAERILQGPGGDANEQQLRLEALIVEGFDLGTLGSFALGRYAQEADSRQVERFDELFGFYAVKSYGRYLANAGGRPFFVGRGRPIGAEEFLVKTRLRESGDGRLQVVWRVRGKPGDQKIVDVFVEGVSMAITLRQEFASAIRSGGMNALLRSLEQQTSAHSVRSTGEAAHFLLQSQLGPFGSFSGAPR